MIDTTSILTTLLPAIVVGYLLGAIPVAALISRKAGVDIFWNQRFDVLGGKRVQIERAIHREFRRFLWHVALPICLRLSV